MDIGSIFLILALVLLVALFISRPFLDRRSENQPLLAKDSLLKADHQRSALLAERDRLMNALQELEFDALLGKIPSEDYPVTRSALMKSGADVLRKLDELQGEQREVTPEVRMEDAVAVITEKAAAQARLQPQTATTQAADVQAVPPQTLVEDELENLIAARRRNRLEKSGGFCPRCGNPVQKSDVFCSRCGKNL